MSRCESVHPWSGLRCKEEAGHTGRHDQDLPANHPHQPKDHEGRARIGKAIEAALSETLRELMSVELYPQEAALAGMLGLTLQLASDCGLSAKAFLRALIGMVAPDPFPLDPSPSQVISYVVSTMLDLPLDASGTVESYELTIRGKGMQGDAPPSPESESAPS